MDYVIIESSAWEALKSRIEGLRERMSELFGSKVEPTELLPGEAVCRILGVSRRTLQYYRDTAALPFVRIEHKCYSKPKMVWFANRRRSGSLYSCMLGMWINLQSLFT